MLQLVCRTVRTSFIQRPGFVASLFASQLAVIDSHSERKRSKVAGFSPYQRFSVAPSRLIRLCAAVCVMTLINIKDKLPPTTVA